MSQSRESESRDYEYELLTTTDPDEASSESEKEAAEPINTRAILRRLQHEAQLVIFNQHLNEIHQRERIKYLLPATAGVAALAGMTGYAVFLAKVLQLPTWKQMFLDAFASERLASYASKFLPAINQTCGSLLPLNQTICLNPLALHPNASYCLALYDNITKMQHNISYFINQIPHLPATSVYDTVCEFPRLLANCFDLGYLRSFSWLCDGEAAQLKAYANASSIDCHAASLISQYNTKHFTFENRGTPNETCGDYFPRDNFCGNTSKKFWDFYDCSYNQHETCTAIDNFSKAVAKFSDNNWTAFQTFSQSVNETLVRYNQTLREYAHIVNQSVAQHVQQLAEYTGKLAELNQQVVPGSNFTCTEHFGPDDDPIYACTDRATQDCKSYLFEENSSFMSNLPAWPLMRILMVTLVTGALVLFLMGAFLLLYRGTSPSCLNQRRAVDDLCDEDKDQLQELFESCEFAHEGSLNEMAIGTASEILNQQLSLLPQEKILVEEMRENFIKSQPRALPAELVHRIFYEAELELQALVDNAFLSEMRFAFLMGREDANSPIPASLSNQLVFAIFFYAGLATRCPPREISMPSLYKNCLTFFSGRQDKNSYIPENTPNNLLHRIFFFAGLNMNSQPAASKNSTVNRTYSV